MPSFSRPVTAAAPAVFPIPTAVAGSALSSSGSSPARTSMFLNSWALAGRKALSRWKEAYRTAVFRLRCVASEAGRRPIRE